MLTADALLGMVSMQDSLRMATWTWDGVAPVLLLMPRIVLLHRAVTTVDGLGQLMILCSGTLTMLNVVVRLRMNLTKTLTLMTTIQIQT